MSEHIKTNWDAFRRDVIPPDAPEVQVTEMRNAFYVGVAMIFADITEKLDSDTSEEDGGKYLYEIHEEVLEFLTEKTPQGNTPGQVTFSENP